ncbi:hypothetical protein [Aquabacterium sp.]|uniref:hypothetical protein n=1 Tax=Aquabacterium sp. TaxID=1872578 RepID=UPI002E301C69|nr:hypothetical protein [Aquabacterium sp.]HEX5311228.1 hypothetical protein [Aquabacterium sp.]
MKSSSICSTRLCGLILYAVLAAATVASAAPNQTHPNAIARFESQFSGSGTFDCNLGKAKLGLSLGLLPYGAKLPTDMPNELRRDQFGIEIESYPSKTSNHIESLWGPATFSDGDKKMSVKLNNNKTAFFERFGPTPDWPFKSKKDSQFFFTFRLDDGPVYQCKAVYQPDQ